MKGVLVHLYTTEKEIKAAKQGASVLVGYTSKKPNALIHISVSGIVCDFLDDEVRVNLEKVNKEVEESAKKFSDIFTEALVAGIEKAGS